MAAFETLSELPETCSFAQFGKIAGVNSVKLKRPNTMLPAKLFQPSHLITTGEEVEKIVVPKFRDTFEQGGEFLIAGFDNHLIFKASEILVDFAFEKVKSVKCDFVKVGAETEIVADVLKNRNFETALKVRQHPIEGFFVENLTQRIFQTSETCKKAIRLAQGNLGPGNFLSGGKSKTEPHSHSLLTITVDHGDVFKRRAKFHFLNLTTARAKNDKTLRAINKIIEILSNEKIFEISDRPVAGWRDAKITRLCAGGLGAGGRGLWLLKFPGSDFNEALGMCEFSKKVESCKIACSYVDPFVYRRNPKDRKIIQQLRDAVRFPINRDDDSVIDAERRIAVWDHFNGTITN